MVRASCVLWALWLVCAVSQPQTPPTRKPSAAPTVPGNATMIKVLSGSSVFYTFHNDIHCGNPAFDYSVPSWGTTTRLNQCVVSPDGLSRRKLLCKLGERMFTLQMGTFALADKSCNKALSYNRAVHRDICAWDFERLGNSLIHCGDDRALLTLQRGATGYLSRAIWPNSRCGSAQEAKVSRVYLSTCTPIWHAKHLGTAFDVARNFKVDSPSIANNWLSLRVLEYAADDLQCAGELTKVWTVRYLLSGPTDGAPRCIPDPLTGNNSFYSSASGAGLPVIWGVSGLYPTPSPTASPSASPTRSPTASPTMLAFSVGISTYLSTTAATLGSCTDARNVVLTGGSICGGHVGNCAGTVYFYPATLATFVSSAASTTWYAIISDGTTSVFIKGVNVQITMTGGVCKAAAGASTWYYATANMPTSSAGVDTLYSSSTSMSLATSDSALSYGLKGLSGTMF